MKCNNCGSLINVSDSFCPNCGEKVNQEENEVLLITENMAPPELAVNQEEMGGGVGDLANGDNVNAYAPGSVNQQTESNNHANNDRVDFSIPTVTEKAIEVDMPTDGSAPEIALQESFVSGNNVNKQDISMFKIGGKTFKINMGKTFGLPIVLVFALLTLIIGIIIGKLLFSKNYCVANNHNSLVNTKIKYVSDGKNNIANVGSFTYKIPQDYTYDKSSNGILVMDKNDGFRIFIGGYPGNIDDLSGAKTSIRETLKENGTNVNKISELNVNGINFLIIETTYKNINRLVTFSDAQNGYVFYMEIVDINNNYNYEVLKIASDIIRNATYEEKSSNMEKIEVNNIYNLTLRASLEYKALINK